MATGPGVLTLTPTVKCGTDSVVLDPIILTVTAGQPAPCGGWVSIADIFDIAVYRDDDYDDPGFHIDASGNVYTTVGYGGFTLTEKTGITYPDPSTTVSIRLVWVSGDYMNAEWGLDVRSRDATDFDHMISFYTGTEDSGLLSSLYTSLRFQYVYGYPSESSPDVWRIEILSDPFCP